MSSPSSLSSCSSMDSPAAVLRTPSKRAASIAFSDHTHSPLLAHHRSPRAHNDSDISSDTSGSVPGSPGGAGDDDFDHAEQVTVCKWDGCEQDMGDMDNLVKHIHDEHIGSRRAKYACEWDDCTRKGLAHASGYALRAHMRSHTKEKPFYCTLPECDRSFTRSDALAKHMRTVHETEALRPSDPIPKSHPNHPHNQPTPRRPAHASPHSSRASSPGSSTDSDSDSPRDPNEPRRHKKKRKSGPSRWYLPEDGFSPDEDVRPPRELVKLLKRKLAWAEQSRDELAVTLDGLERRRREGWVKKEVLLDRVLEVELGREVAGGLSLGGGGESKMGEI